MVFCQNNLSRLRNWYVVLYVEILAKTTKGMVHWKVAAASFWLTMLRCELPKCRDDAGAS